MKWLFLLFSAFKPFFSIGVENSNPIQEIKYMIQANAMRVMVMMVVAFSLATIFAGGLILFAIDIGAQYDQTGYIYFSSMMAMGLILSGLSFITVAIIAKSFKHSDHRDKRKEHLSMNNVGTVHPLQDALALLVMDFIKEREHKRAREEESNIKTQGEMFADEEMRH